MRKSLLLIGLPLVLLAAVACEPVPYWIGNTSGPKIFVAGDSVMYRAKPYVEANIQGTYQDHFAAAPTIVISDFQPFADTAVTQGPVDQAILNGGHNNGRNGQTPQQAWAEFVPIVNTLLGSRCVHIMTLSAHSPYDDVNTWNTAFNAEIRAQVAALNNPRVRVVPWDTYVANYLTSGKWFSDPLFYDGLHPTETGGNAISQLLLDSIAACPA